MEGGYRHPARRTGGEAHRRACSWSLHKRHHGECAAEAVVLAEALLPIQASSPRVQFRAAHGSLRNITSSILYIPARRHRTSSSTP